MTRVPTSLLRQTISVENLLGSGAYGDTFAAVRTMRASVQHTENFVEGERGQQRVIDTVVIIRPEDGPVPVGSRVTSGTDTFRVVKTFPIPDAHSPSHYELMVSRWEVIL